jgi:hypothetical protein
MVVVDEMFTNQLDYILIFGKHTAEVDAATKHGPACLLLWGADSGSLGQASSERGSVHSESLCTWKVQH